MSKFQRKLAQKMGQKTITIPVTVWDNLGKELKTLKDAIKKLPNYDDDLYDLDVGYIEHCQERINNLQKQIEE